LNPYIALLIGLVISVLLFSIYWVVQRQIENSAIVDVFWGLSVAVVGVFFCCVGSGDATRRWVAGVLLTIWAVRLSYFLFIRWRSHEEDARYADLKVKWGDQAQFRMFRFYQMQGLGAYLFALPCFALSMQTRTLGWLDYAGILIWIIAVVGEAISDHQLAVFKRNPENKGEVCQTGMWKYSRHPNYFFEWLHWWTYVCMSLTLPFGWLTILVPVAMWFFLNRVTGIPLTEAQSIKSRGEKYRRYQETTSAFFPWFPKNSNIENPSEAS
jgi:steroid 5-alpha reductase family enzyme